MSIKYSVYVPIRSVQRSHQASRREKHLLGFAMAVNCLYMYHVKVFQFRVLSEQARFKDQLLIHRYPLHIIPVGIMMCCMSLLQPPLSHEVLLNQSFACLQQYQFGRA